MTQARRTGRRPVLAYLYAAPDFWPGGRPVAAQAHAAHRAEIERFAAQVAGDEVAFVAVSWREVLDTMAASPLAGVREHAGAVAAAFAPLWPGHAAV